MLTCEICDRNNMGFPELVPGGDSWHRPLVCPVCGAAHDSGGGLKDVPEGVVGERKDDGDPSNPGNFQQQNRRLDGSLKQPTAPTVPPGKPVPKPLPGQQPPFGTPAKPRVVP
jgi:hypothetical protein